jgi:hypothetical protein
MIYYCIELGVLLIPGCYKKDVRRKLHFITVGVKFLIWNYKGNYF